MELILVRHAEAERLAADADGAADPPLSDRGRRQAARVARWLAADPVDCIVSSPALRARQTAEETGALLGLSVALDERLRDIHPVDSAYVALEADREGDRARYRERVAGYAERSELQALGERVRTALAEWAGSWPGGRVVLFCHGSVINVYAADVLGLGAQAFFEARPGSGHRFLVASSGIRSVVSLNETAYLRAAFDPAAAAED